jgi:hypothetical protein
MLDAFVDSLIQSFENCRAGLSDEALSRPADVETFFAQLYDKERPRLTELVQLSYSHLSDADRQGLLEKIDGRIRDILIPAYARVAGRFTARERNDFYLSHESWHALERLGFAAAAMVIGAFVVWAPFIPIWSKEWVAVFALGGLVFPDLRRLLSWKRYEAELNTLVSRTDDEIFRMDLALLTHEPPHASLAPVVRTTPEKEPPSPVPPPRARQGGR